MITSYSFWFFFVFKTVLHLLVVVVFTVLLLFTFEKPEVIKCESFIDRNFLKLH